MENVSYALSVGFSTQPEQTPLSPLCIPLVTAPCDTASVRYSTWRLVLSQSFLRHGRHGLVVLDDGL